MDSSVREKSPRMLYNEVQRSWYEQKQTLDDDEYVYAATSIRISMVLPDSVLEQLTATQLYTVGRRVCEELGYESVPSVEQVLGERALVVEVLEDVSGVVIEDVSKLF